MQRRSKGGPIDIEKEIQELKTNSGIRNWHLMVPSWGAGEMSGKSRKKEEMALRREIEKWAREENEVIGKKMERKREWEQVKVDYATVGLARAGIEQEKLTKSIMEGMKKRRKLGKSESGGEMKEKIGSGDDDDDDADADDDEGALTSLLSSSFLCTLSGDVVVEDEATDITINAANDANDSKPKSEAGDETKVTMIQSKSEFATAAILMNPDKFEAIKSSSKGLYYEITIETEGIAQIGWANILTCKQGRVLPSTGKHSFLPNSDTGDGVGDDAFSYGYDGSRGRIFHNGKESSYGEKDVSSGWKKGDVIGCLYDFTNGSIEFSINGHGFGKAFEIEKSELLYPVFSLNEKEIVGMNIGPSFHHCPKGFQGISALINVQDECTLTVDEKENEMDIVLPDATGVASIGGVVLPPPASTTSSQSLQKLKPAENHEVESKQRNPINLDSYNSSRELEELGMDRLKEELYELGCKCGGSLQERSKRLYSLKGLSSDQIPKELRGKHFKD